MNVMFCAQENTILQQRRRSSGRAVQVRIEGGNDGIPQIWKYDRSKDRSG